MKGETRLLGLARRAKRLMAEKLQAANAKAWNYFLPISVILFLAYGLYFYYIVTYQTPISAGAIAKIAEALLTVEGFLLALMALLPNPRTRAIPFLSATLSILISLSTIAPSEASNSLGIQAVSTGLVNLFIIDVDLFLVTLEVFFITTIRHTLPSETKTRNQAYQPE